MCKDDFFINSFLSFKIFPCSNIKHPWALLEKCFHTKSQLQVTMSVSIIRKCCHAVNVVSPIINSFFKGELLVNLFSSTNSSWYYIIYVYLKLKYSNTPFIFFKINLNNSLCSINYTVNFFLKTHIIKL